MTDPFDTAALRQRVLDAWAASPARFREDANAEEELVLGGYRDRLVVELAQNAADAADRAGVAGRLRLALREGALVAANTGAPLDAEGVQALSTLRASAKRDERAAVGRFGVGFAAVLAVTDEPRICSRTGAVRWSRDETLDRVRAVGALAGELARREESVPVLRLPFPVPFPAAGELPEGFDTSVVLPLRDERAEALTRRLLDDTGPALLIGLPALEALEVEVDGVIHELRAVWSGDVVTVDVGGAPTRWRLARKGGRLDPGLLADRPTEERARPSWSVTWAVPVEGGDRPYRTLPPGVPQVVHAPTPSEERLDLPALLLASFPLAADRRHVAPGPLTDFLVRAAGQAYAKVLLALPADPAVLFLVPGPAAVGELDAKLRRAILGVLPETPFLPSAADPRARVAPRAAVVVDAGAALLDILASVVDGLVPAGWPPRAQAFTALGVRHLRLADVIDLLAGLDRGPQWWRETYAALEGADAEALGALPVPLADGRLVRGVRGLLIAVEGVDPARLAPLGLRFVHPDALHPLLRRLGALPAAPRVVLDDPATRAAVTHSYDEDDPGPVADAVLSLVAAAGLEPGEAAWLADLALPADDGEWSPAGELLLPESPLAGVIAEDAPLGVLSPDVVARFGPQACEAAGVLRTFGVVREADVPLDPEIMDHDLDGEDRWAAEVLARLPEGPEGAAPPLLREFVAVRDLDLVDPGLWEDALGLLAGSDLRAAAVDPARVLLPDGREVRVPSYTAWWLARHPVVAGRRPTELRVTSDPLLAGLYDDAPYEADAELLGAIGARTTLAALLGQPGGPDDLLARLADPGLPVARSQLRALLSALATVDVDRVAPPERVRALVGREVKVVSAEEAVVVDAPDLVPLLGGRPLLLVHRPAAEPLADVLDVALASEVATGAVESSGADLPVPDVVRELLPEAPGTYVAHDRLVVDGHEVSWRCVGGVVHASGTAGLARGLAWAAGRFEARLLVEALLADPDRAGELLAEADLDG